MFWREREEKRGNMYFHDKKIANCPLYNLNAVGQQSNKKKKRFAGDAVINILELFVYYNFTDLEWNADPKQMDKSML